MSKLAGEHYLKHLTQCDVDYTIFRLFNTYGPGQDIHHMMKGIVSALLSQIIAGHTVNVTGSLERYRDLTYVDDCVDALIMGMDDELSNNTYNIRHTVDGQNQATHWPTTAGGTPSPRTPSLEAIM